MEIMRIRIGRISFSSIGRFTAAGFLCLALLAGAAHAQVTMPAHGALKQMTQEAMLDFALAVKAKDFTVFYTKISQLWQSQTTKEQLAQLFRSFIDQDIDLTILAGHEPAFKKKPYLDPNGWLALQGGYEVYPFIVDFTLKYLYEAPAWKLVGIDVETSPMAGSRPTPGAMPTTEELQKMVEDTMLDFARAVNSRDFSGLYARLSESWKKQITLEKLAATFKPFSDNNIDLTGLKGHEPVFTQAPSINEKGLLRLKGIYKVYPLGVPFDLTYIYEAPSWKPFGVNVKVTPMAAPKAQTGGIPPEPQLKELAHRTMLDFARAVKAKDFGDFYDTVAKVWQNQTPRDAFGRLFKAFTDKNIDLTIIDGLDPALEKKPYLDNNGWLHLDGAYPTKPSETHFNLKYFPGDGGWKLVGINIQIR
ncbi:MAG: hypothetical protein JW883_04505 [Deltaproteobacteria bacterium]|nr:hypothetical protein [Deltaproteobacteria bacterium]